MTVTPMQRFVSKVRVIPCGGCWEWCAYINQDGYGKFTVRHHVERYAHRWYWEQVNGELPAHMQLDHLCRNRACVNPSHLEPVTNRENTVRGRSPELTRQRWANYTHCTHGHEYTPENTRIDSAGRRRCRQCEALRELRRKPSCPTCGSSDREWVNETTARNLGPPMTACPHPWHDHSEQG